MSLQTGAAGAAQAVPTAAAGVVFDVRRLSKVYHMGEVEVHALRQVDLTLTESQFVVLLGPSGSGKSTLLNILGGLDVPTSGQVFYHGQELTATDEAARTEYRRQYVGFVFQFYNLIPRLTARKNVALVTEISDHPFTPEEALGLVDLGPRQDHFPSQLSGGEQQRVAIARAIAKRPAVLLCDEPTGGSTSRPGWSCSRRWRASTPSSARPPWSSRTTPLSRRWLTASCG